MKSCKKGHLMTPENSILTGKWPQCRECCREKDRLRSKRRGQVTQWQQYYENQQPWRFKNALKDRPVFG